MQLCASLKHRLTIIQAKLANSAHPARTITTQTSEAMLTMKQLLIVAHGSRREASNEEIRTLASQVAKYLQLPVDTVQVAFLELATPSIETALKECFQQGTTEVKVLPYFLSSGTHVVNDLPGEIAAAQEIWPNKIIKLLPHIGAADSMISLIASVYHST